MAPGASAGVDRVAAKTPDPKGTGRRVRYVGRSRDLFWIYLKNLVLTFVTLGIYRFWATTRVRRFIWSHLRFLDEPFEYVGTGKELFFGFLKAMLALIPIRSEERRVGKEWVSTGRI